jgi:prepilin signal peptidase PulO-like enzyme (type II secretory pathway)
MPHDASSKRARAADQLFVAAWALPFLQKADLVAVSARGVRRWYSFAGRASAGTDDRRCGSVYALPLLRDWIFISFLTVVFVIDLRHGGFDSVTLPAAGLAFLINIVLGHDVLNLLLAAVVGAGFFLLQYIVSRGRWIGGGDIRIGAMMGMMLGFPLVILALFAAYIVGAIVALGLMAAGKAKWTGQMAFGTFLSVATVLALFFGQDAMNWYATLLGL